MREVYFEIVRSWRRNKKKINLLYEYHRYLLPYSRKRIKSLNDQTANISIFSNPRGGSTWVSEVLQRLPNSILISEPMFISPPYREMKKVDFCFNQYIPESESWPEAEEFFRKLYNIEVNSFKSLRLYYYNESLSKINDAKYFLFKDVNSNMLLPWLSNRFEINPVFIIRHPCAVVASQLKYRHWDYIKNDVKYHFPDPDCRFKEIYWIYSDIISKIKYPEERLAAEWALQNSVPIKNQRNNKSWITESYEQLYLHPEQRFKRLFDRLKLKMPIDFFTQIRKPSNSAIPTSYDNIKSGKQLESWRNDLTKIQTDRILKIIKEFGMDFYDESNEPDYSRIFNNLDY